MTEDEFKERVIELLEIIAFGKPEPEGCQHENAVDTSVMGMQPGERMRCNDCGAECQRIQEV